jgi:hypothetical protein
MIFGPFGDGFFLVALQMTLESAVSEICLLYGLSEEQVRLVLRETEKRIPEFQRRFGESFFFELCKFQVKHYEAMQRINAQYY